MDEEKIRKRVTDLQEYIDAVKLMYHSATNEEKKSRALAYWGFALMIKELFELQLPKPSTKTQEEIKKEKEKEETMDWIMRSLKDQAKDLERP